MDIAFHAVPLTDASLASTVMARMASLSVVSLVLPLVVVDGRFGIFVVKEHTCVWVVDNRLAVGAGYVVELLCCLDNTERRRHEITLRLAYGGAVRIDEADETVGGCVLLVAKEVYVVLQSIERSPVIESVAIYGGWRKECCPWCHQIAVILAYCGVFAHQEA